MIWGRRRAPAADRRLLLTLAKQGLFEAPWSEAILDETHRALTGTLSRPGASDTQV